MAHEQSINKVLIFIFGFVLGVLVSSFIFISPLVGILILFVGVCVFLGEKVWEGSVSNAVLVLSLLIIAFSFGTLRYSVKDFHEPLVPSNIGIVISEPEEKENTTRFVLKSDNGEKVLVSTDLYSEVEYGDKISATRKLEEPGIIDDGTGRPFDYAKYLAKDDIYYTLNFAEVGVISSGHGNQVKSTLFKLKNSFIKKIREIFAEPESSLLAGLIVAGKAAMPKSVLEEFRRSGIIHIVVLSGFNITIIADFMRRSFQKLFIWSKLGVGPKFPALASIIGILLFVIMTGAEATVVRAAIMVLVVIAAKMFGRNYSAPRALLGAAFLMVLHNPKILVFDPSFQLSFIATCALIYIAPIVERYIKRIPDIWGFRGMLATTIATQIAVLPYLVYAMGEVSLVSLPANILVLLLIPYTMFFGFLATLLAFIHPIIAWPISYLSHLLLAWTMGVSSFLGNLSFASIAIPSFPFWAVLALYILLITFVKRWQGSPPRSAS